MLEKRIIAVIDKLRLDEIPDIMIPYRAIDLNSFDEYLEQLVNRAKGEEK